MLAIPRLSATVDEPVHLAAGYSYWVTRDFRINPEHPPLAKLLAALPLLLFLPRLDVSKDEWKSEPDEYLIGFKFLYQTDADRLLFWGRFAMVILAALGLIVTFLWARDLFGPAAGLCAAALYGFCPNLLAHGMLITTDVPLAVFTLLTLYLFWKRSNIGAGLALGAAMATKFSGALLPVLLVILALTRDRRSAIKSLAIMAASSLVVIEAAYLFSASPLLYFKNAFTVNANHVRDYPVYLFGQFRPGGWWYYFLAAFIVKATAPTLILIVLATVQAARGFVNRWAEIILLAGIGGYVIVISAAADQIGIRYLLPVFPLIFVWVSRIVPDFRSARAGTVALALLLIWHAWSGIRAFPNYIPYFNEVARLADTAAFLDDSNVDWGQGLKEAAKYVLERRLDRVTMHTFSPFDNPRYYGLPANIRPADIVPRLLDKRPDPGIYIISVHHVIRMRGIAPAWKTYEPVDRIGEALGVFAF